MEEHLNVFQNRQRVTIRSLITSQRRNAIVSCRNLDFNKIDGERHIDKDCQRAKRHTDSGNQRAKGHSDND